MTTNAGQGRLSHNSSQVAVSNVTPTQLAPARPGRADVIFQNLHDTAVVTIGKSDVNTAGGYVLGPHAESPPFEATDQWFGISTINITPVSVTDSYA